MQYENAMKTLPSPTEFLEEMSHRGIKGMHPSTPKKPDFSNLDVVGSVKAAARYRWDNLGKIEDDVLDSMLNNISKRINDMNVLTIRKSLFDLVHNPTSILTYGFYDKPIYYGISRQNNMSFADYYLCLMAIAEILMLTGDQRNAFVYAGVNKFIETLEKGRGATKPMFIMGQNPYNSN